MPKYHWQLQWDTPKPSRLPNSRGISTKSLANSSAKTIADLKKGGLDDVINDADHRKAIINAAKRVVKVDKPCSRG